MARSPGFVADFCIGCCDVQAFKILPPRNSVDHAVIESCVHCGLLFQIDRNAILSVSPEQLPLPDLIRKTRPFLPAECLECVDVIRTVASGRADPPERARVLRLPFQFLQSLVAQHTAEFGGRWLLVVVGSIAGGFIAPFLLAMAYDFVGGVLPSFGAWLNGHREFRANTLGLSCVVPAACLFYFCFRAGRRRWKKKFHGHLARAVRPFRPTEQEIREVAKWLKDTNDPLAKYIDLRLLYSTMSAMVDTSFKNFDEFNLEAVGREMIAEAIAQREAEAA